MKVAIEQKTFESLVKRGAMAALSEEAQGDTTNLAPLIKSVKIDASNGQFSVESATNLVTIKVSSVASKENGFDVKEDGVAVILAKELIDWTAKQGGSKIGISLSKLDIPEVVETESTDEISKDVVKKIADLKISSKDSTRTGSKWSLDSYDHSQLPKTIKSPSNKLLLFSCEPKKIENAINSILFSVQPKDYQHVFDSLVVQRVGDELFIGSTDQKRCSIYNITSIVKMGEYFSNDGAKILIPAYTLQNIIKNSSESHELSFVYDEEKHALYIEQEGMTARMSIPEKNLYSKFPSLTYMFRVVYNDLCVAPKSTLNRCLSTVSLVNKECALFVFDESKKELITYAASDSGKSPSKSTCPVDNLKSNCRYIWSIQHVVDMIKATKDENISIMVAENGQSFKVVSKTDPNLQMYGMHIDNPKYSNVTVE